jgi:hypothetical protein
LPLINATDIATSAGFNTDKITWLSGGFSPWLFDQNTNNLQSGDILNDQKSILKAQISGTGKLNFDWAVDSEKNYDFLNLVINNQEVEKISASNDFTNRQFFVEQPQNNIYWIYEKDGSESTGADQAYLYNVTFTPMSKDQYEQQLEKSYSTEGSSNGGGGGALGWLNLLLILPVIFFRRVYLT